MLKQTVLCLLLGGLLAACAASRGGGSDGEPDLRPSLAPSRLYKVGDTTYAVSRRPESRTGIRVRTHGGGNGTQKAAYIAATRAYGCQSLRLTETVPVWRVADGHGSFCEFDLDGGVNR